MGHPVTLKKCTYFYLHLEMVCSEWEIHRIRLVFSINYIYLWLLAHAGKRSHLRRTNSIMILTRFVVNTCTPGVISSRERAAQAGEVGRGRTHPRSPTHQSSSICWPVLSKPLHLPHLTFQILPHTSFLPLPVDGFHLQLLPHSSPLCVPNS